MLHNLLIIQGKITNGVQSFESVAEKFLSFPICLMREPFVLQK
jgi:hypothetical protein